MSTWTFSGDPAASDKDAVRHKVGDTNCDKQIVSDEAIEYELAQFPGDPRRVLKASINVAKAIAAYFAQESTYRIGQVSETLSRKSEAYERIVDQLEHEIKLSARRSVLPAMIAHSKSLKRAAELDTDRVEPGIRVGMDDYFTYSDDVYGTAN
jgi:hypothetical protein